MPENVMAYVSPVNEAALTTEPAKLLGAEGQLGRIAAGRPAHLVVMSGDFNVAATKVRMVFADGVRFDVAEPTADEGTTTTAERGPGRGGPRGGRGPGMGRGAEARAETTPVTQPIAFVGPPTWEDANTEIEADRAAGKTAADTLA